MQILDIYIQGFGKLSDKKLSFSNNLNIIQGENEAGKSSIHSFIRAIFYGLDRKKGRASKNDTWSRFNPWHKEFYGGYIRFIKNETTYRLERDFRKNANKPLTLIDESKGVEIENPDSLLNRLLNGLSMIAYSNTISIGQLKSVTDSEMNNELKKYISNMNNTQNQALDISKALDYLKLQKKKISKSYIIDAQKTYNNNLVYIKDLEQKLENLQNQKLDFKPQNHEIACQIEEYHKKINSINNYIEENKNFLKNTGFESLEDLVEYKSKFNQKIEALNQAKSDENINKDFLLRNIFATFSIASGILFIYLFLSGQNNLITKFFNIPYDISLSIFLFVCTLSMISLSIVSKMIISKNSQIKFINNTLRLLIEDLTGDKDISENSINKCIQILEKYQIHFKNVEEANNKLNLISSDLLKLNIEKDKLNQNLEESHRQTWEIEKLIEQISNIEDENVALLKIMQENKRLKKELDAIDLAIVSLEKLSLNIKDSFGFYLNKNASELMNNISNGLYNSISVDKDMNIFLNTTEKLIPIEQASSATKDQIYLALRLASAKLMQEEYEPLPLILDDSFVNYDNNRLSHVLEFLSSTNFSQILLFTCQDRENKILKNLEKDFNFISI